MKRMHLTYLTRVDIGSSAAQARQIQDMARAFYCVLGNKFLLVSSGNLPVGSDIPHRVPYFSKVRAFRYLGICLYTISHATRARGDITFTRDMLVAAISVFLGRYAIYEAHKEPKSFFSRSIMTLLAPHDRLRIVTISNSLSNYYHENYSVPHDRLLTAHDGAFYEDYVQLRNKPKAELRDELSLPLDRVTIVHTGSLYKGGAEKFGLFFLLGHKNLQFIHVGGTNKECKFWQSYYHSRGNYEIAFIPHKPIEVVRKYQVAADFLFYVTTKNNPIYWCTSPLKIFEYMASGNPIIGSNIGSVSEILDETVAFVFDPDSDQQLIEAFKECLENIPYAKRKSKLALQLAASTFDWKIRARRIVNYCSDI